MEFLYLFLVSGAGFVAALVGAYSITRWMTRDTRQKEPSFKIDFQLHSNHALHKHQLFWLVALTPVAIGLALNIKIFWGVGFDFSIEGFDHWVKNSTLTLGLMALGIPFGVMVGSFHRTLQTAEQIRQAESSNNFKNYFEHKKIFTDSLIRSVGAHIEHRAGQWHSMLFKQAKNGFFCIDESVLERLHYFDELVARYSYLEDADLTIKKELDSFEDSQDYMFVSNFSSFVSEEDEDEGRALSFGEGDQEFLEKAIDFPFVNDNELFDDGITRINENVVSPVILDRVNLFLDILIVAIGCSVDEGGLSTPVILEKRFCMQRAFSSFLEEPYNQEWIIRLMVSKFGDERIGEYVDLCFNFVDKSAESKRFLVEKQLYRKIQDMLEAQNR